MEQNKFDFQPIEPECDCEVCKKYTRSYFYLTINKNPRAVSMISFHNIYYLLNLLRRLRQSIIDKKVNEFCIDFFSKQFDRKYPKWVYDALKKAGVDVSFMSDDLRDDVNQDMKLYEDIND